MTLVSEYRYVVCSCVGLAQTVALQFHTQLIGYHFPDFPNSGSLAASHKQDYYDRYNGGFYPTKYAIVLYV